MSFTCKEPKLRFPEFSGEWVEKKLIDTIDTNVKWSFTGGPFGSDLKSDDYTDEGVRIIQLQNIGDGIFLNDYAIYTSEEKANRLLSCNIYADELILSKMGDPVARACKMPTTNKRYVMASDGIRFVPDENKYSKDFLFFSINHPTFRKKAIINSTGSTRKRIGLTELRNITFLLPSKPEQEKIASFLTAVDAKIEQFTCKEKLLEKYKKSVMQKLFSQELRFTCNDGSEYPEWEEKKLGEIGKFNAGGDLDKLDYSKEKNEKYLYPIYANGSGEGLYGYATTFQYKENCVTVSGRGSLGYANVRNQKFNAIVRLIVIEPKENVNSKFLEETINKINFAIESTGVPQLTVPQISSYKINLPSLPEQTKIANFLSTIDEKLLHVKAQTLQTQQFKKALLQQMFV